MTVNQWKGIIQVHSISKITFSKRHNPRRQTHTMQIIGVNEQGWQHKEIILLHTVLYQ